MKTKIINLLVFKIEDIKFKFQYPSESENFEYLFWTLFAGDALGIVNFLLLYIEAKFPCVFPPSSA